jgi:hypothetical protein
MALQTTDLYLLEDLEDPSRTRALAGDDRRALHAIADWIKSYVVRPHAELGRSGPVCPYVPLTLERGSLWLAVEHVADRSPSEIVAVIDDYRRQLLAAPPVGANDDDPKVIAVVFSDLPADQARGIFEVILERLALRSYQDDGVLYGPYYEGNEVPAVHNPSFRPFESPAPFVFVRSPVKGDWEFFLDNDDLMRAWAQRYGESGVLSLAAELRRFPWRSQTHEPQGGAGWNAD